MRDGGNKAWNMSSNHLDIQVLFLRAITLCSSKAAMLGRYRNMNENVKWYLEMGREPTPEPVLDNQRTDDNCCSGVLWPHKRNTKQHRTEDQRKWWHHSQQQTS